MAPVNPLLDRRVHVMREAAKRWENRGVEAASSGLSEVQATDTPSRQRQFAEREALLQQASQLRALGRLPRRLERKIGSTLDFIENAPSEAARKAGRPVVRIVSDCDPKVQAEGFATGFLVAPRLILTNWHVFPDAGSAIGNGANFFHDRGEEGVAIGDTCELDPEYFFFANERLDFAIVGVKQASVGGVNLSDVEPAAMTSATGKILLGQSVNIIQHPAGGPKTWVTEKDNRLTDISEEGFLQYTADTLGGSSGSPVFSNSWELVAVHHSGVPEIRDGKIMSTEGTEWNEDMGDEKVNWIANEGIRVSAVIRALAETGLTDVRQQAVLDNLLAGTGDPVEEVRQLIEQSTNAAVDPLKSPVASLQPGAAHIIFTGPVTIILGGEAAANFTPPTSAALERAIRFDPDYSERQGFQSNFLGDGIEVALPTVSAARDSEMLKKDGQVQVLDYHHFSLAMNASKRLLMWSALNVDYAPASRQIGGRAGFGSDKWIYDPRVPKELQIGEKEFYGPAKQSDRGHVVRRQDNAWGATPAEIEYANSDTFHWTNCTPHHAAFNRASAPSVYQLEEGLWGGFEMYTQKELQKGDTRACILAGPVLADDDPVEDFGFGPIVVPLRFWKIVVVADNSGAAPALQAHGFIMSQEDLVDRFGIEFSPGRFSRYRASLAQITEASGVEFAQEIVAADRFVGG